MQLVSNGPQSSGNKFEDYLIERHHSDQWRGEGGSLSDPLPGTGMQRNQICDAGLPESETCLVMMTSIQLSVPVASALMVSCPSAPAHSCLHSGSGSPPCMMLVIGTYCNVLSYKCDMIVQLHGNVPLNTTIECTWACPHHHMKFLRLSYLHVHAYMYVYVPFHCTKIRSYLQCIFVASQHPQATPNN